MTRKQPVVKFSRKAAGRYYGLGTSHAYLITRARSTTPPVGAVTSSDATTPDPYTNPEEHPMNLPARVQSVADTLAKQGIGFVFDTANLTAQDAWTEASTATGRRIAVIHEYRGTWTDQGLRSPDSGGAVRDHTFVYFDYRQPDVAETIVNAFWLNGFTVVWDCDPRSAIRIGL